MQNPNMQEEPALQTLSHIPQFCASMSRFVQSFEHASRPGLHVHVPMLQSSFILQAIPQPLQLLESESKFVHAPLHGSGFAAPQAQLP